MASGVVAERDSFIDNLLVRNPLNHRDDFSRRALRLNQNQTQILVRKASPMHMNACTRVRTRLVKRVTCCQAGQPRNLLSLALKLKRYLSNADPGAQGARGDAHEDALRYPHNPCTLVSIYKKFRLKNPTPQTLNPKPTTKNQNPNPKPKNSR